MRNEYVEYQQLSARVYLQEIAEFSEGKRAMVLGGAPRAWFTGRAANDIDIYVNGTVDEVGKIALKLWRDWGRDGTALNEEGDYGDEYGGADYVDRVYTFENARYTKVQIIATNRDPYDVMKKFPVNLSRCGYTENGDAIYTQDFLKGMHNRVINVNGITERGYVEKIMGYYPDFVVVPSGRSVDTLEEIPF